MTAPGAPPPLRGHTAWHLLRFAIACRSSAIVLDLQGHPAHATHLRALATAADTRAAQRTAAEPTSLPRAA